MALACHRFVLSMTQLGDCVSDSSGRRWIAKCERSMACLLVVLEAGQHERSRSDLVHMGQTGSVEPGSPINFLFDRGLLLG